MKAAWVFVLVLSADAFGQAWLRETNLPAGFSSFHHWTLVAAAGDVDGDDVPDMAAAPGTFTSLPAFVRMYSGATGAQLFQFDSSSTVGDSSIALAGVGDVNDDGVTDIGYLVAHPSFPTSALTTDAVEVFSGADGAPLLALAEADPADQFESFCGLGDLNGDGHDDVAVGAVRGQSAGQELGYVRLFSGADGSVINTWWAPAPEWFGYVVVDAGDFDADGLHDVAVSVFDHWTPQSGYGMVQVISSADGSVLLELLPDGGEYWGTALAAPGDVDGDTVPDLLVGDTMFQQLIDNTYYDPPGAVHLYSGASGAFIDGWQGSAFMSAEAGHELGTAISVLDDMDGDGVRDFVLSSKERTIEVVSGASHERLYKLGANMGTFANDGVSVGDVDGDGFGDVAVSGPYRFNIVRLAPWGTWLSGGLGLAGSHGVPVATGSGELDGGDVVTLSLGSARENAVTALVLSGRALDAPFKGGTLFPSPAGGLLIPMSTDGAGEIVLSAEWPVGLPPGLVIFHQFWIADPAGPHGFAASNVVSCSSN